MKKARKDDPYGYFLIEDTFCNDVGDPYAIDHSKPILDGIQNSKDEAIEKWEGILYGELQQKQKAVLESGTKLHLQHFKSYRMHQIRFCDLHISKLLSFTELPNSENDAHKIYQGLNCGNDFKHCEAYKILARESQWANLRDDGLNHAENILRNVARRTSDHSSPGNSVGSNNLSEDPDGLPIPESVGPNSDLDGLLYEGGSRPIGQIFYRRNLAARNTLDGVAASGSGI
ncbi:hypothetical protein GIB67_034831 [Kingdonia uniflora]|uniref:Uncharacterized protein n=1 Tax=Kingdonia uniflora TaxID=39325 RepID=A0A7J7MDW0_9MAGN|nr:hypothetical protein GIB67_034831 [Kingdonia uniflora]